jgi:signal transduction histidine kinase
MIRRLQRKFVLAAMLSLLIVLALLIGLINILNYVNVLKEADETLALLAENGGAFPKRPDEPEPEPRRDDRGYGKRNYSGELPFQSRYFSVTLSGSGEVCASDLNNVATVDRDTAIEMTLAAAKKGRDRGTLDDYRYLRTDGGEGTRWIFLNRERELASVRSFLLISSGISLGGLLLVFLLMMLLSGRIVRPIAQSYEKQKRFITDAGHELKTPITIINADADVLSESLPDSEWLSDIHKQTERLSTLTNSLIYLSKMEEEGAKPLMIEFPLSEVVEDTAQPFSTVFRTQEQTYTADVQPLLSLNGDEASIRKLVTILLDNAAKYTPAKGAIALSLKKSGHTIRLAVENTAAGIEKGNADRLFDRFYRTDASRNSETGGFGLGLAMAKAVTEAHGGRIRAYSPDGKTLVVEALFPAQGGK